MNVFIKNIEMVGAKRYVRGAAIVTVLSAGITALILVSEFFTEHAGNVRFWMFADVAIMLALAYGIMKYSRVCAVLAFLYYLVDQGFHARAIEPSDARVVWLVIVIVFIYYYLQGLRGVFAYHLLEPISKSFQQDNDSRQQHETEEID